MKNQQEQQKSQAHNTTLLPPTLRHIVEENISFEPSTPRNIVEKNISCRPEGSHPVKKAKVCHPKKVTLLYKNLTTYLRHLIKYHTLNVILFKR